MTRMKMLVARTTTMKKKKSKWVFVFKRSPDHADHIRAKAE